MSHHAAHAARRAHLRPGARPGRLFASAGLFAAALACAPAAEDPPDDEPPPDPEPRSYAVPVPLPASMDSDRWPSLALSADEDLAALSSRNDGLIVTDATGARRSKTSSLSGAGLAASGDTLAIVADGTLTLTDLDGAVLTPARTTGVSTSVAAHPDGGFVVAYETSGDTHIERVATDGTVTPLVVLDGWSTGDWPTRPLAVRNDGAVGLVLRGADTEQPEQLLGVTLVPDLLTEVGNRHLLVVIDADGALIEALTFRSFDRPCSMRAGDEIELLAEEVPVDTSVRSALTGDLLAEGRVEAQRVAAVVFVGATTRAQLLEGTIPLFARDDRVFALHQDEDTLLNVLTDGFGFSLPLLAGGTCRSFTLTDTRLVGVCEEPPVDSTGIATVGDDDDDDTGWALSVLRTDIGL